MGSKLFFVLFVLWWFYPAYKRYKKSLPPPLAPRQHWALALAHPFARTTKFKAFYASSGWELTDEMRAHLRPQLLHRMGLRTDAGGDEAREHLARTLESHWFRADLKEWLTTDDPRAALAFACARTAFFVRALMMMEWIEPQVAWRVLLLNAQRAQDCFASWEDYGRAFIAGRSQWVAAFRADPFGAAYDEKALAGWLSWRRKGWRRLPWPGPAAFSPTLPAEAPIKHAKSRKRK